MARKSLGFVNLIWTCPSCDTQNPGPIKSCTSCGAPQPDDIQFEKIDQEHFDFIKDEALIRMAKAGPDKHCPYCGTRNTSKAERCKKCGADISIGAKARQSGEKVGAKSIKPSTPTTPKKKNKTGCIIGAVVIGIFVILGIILLINLLKTDTVNATVDAVNWSRSIAVEAYGPVSAEDWYDEIPSDADIVSCSMKFRYSSDEPQANATEVCGEPYTVDTGTGVGEVVQDCTYEVYDDYCEYIVMAWAVVDEITLTGNDLQPQWPNLSLSTEQRLGKQAENYAIIFDASGKQYTYTTSDLSLYSYAFPGSQWILKVNGLGAVTSAAPAN